MSGVAPKGPNRPPDEPPPEYESAPLYGESKFSLQGKYPKIVMLLLCIILTIMFIVAFSLCVYGGVQHQQPRYFLLIVNIILSTLVTGLLIFWYFRGSLSSMMLWYVFVQCLFLLFQFITTDIFAFYEQQTGPAPTLPPWTPVTNCNKTPHLPECGNSSNHTNGTYGPLFEEKYLYF